MQIPALHEREKFEFGVCLLLEFFAVPTEYWILLVQSKERKNAKNRGGLMTLNIMRKIISAYPCGNRSKYWSIFEAKQGHMMDVL